MNELENIRFYEQMITGNPSVIYDMYKPKLWQVKLALDCGIKVDSLLRHHVTLDEEVERYLQSLQVLYI